ncbi:trypsin-like peptidase domain-containing protein [Streptomyces boninensis]|uniref:nSTAND1 domain-containing NTPase n=1 Tax=Streptomyces boninensis TaxID=2039455 RepID=UPI003B210CE8
MSSGKPSALPIPNESVLRAYVHIHSADRHRCGAGFLFASGLVLTCAHVVQDALGLDRRQPVDPGAGPVLIALAVDGTQSVRATVEKCIELRDDQSGDVAVLCLDEPLPGAAPVSLSEDDGLTQRSVLVPGPLDNPARGPWHEGKLLGKTMWGAWQMTPSGGMAINYGSSGSPAWDADSGGVAGMVVAATLSGDRQAYVIPVDTLVKELPHRADLLRPPCPFLGLDTFQEHDSGKFYGRTDDVKAVECLTDEHRYVTVLGPSGSGKSSLVRAGVVPALTAQGRAPLVLTPGGPSADAHPTRWSDLLRQEQNAGAEPRRDGAQKRTVIVLDQAEQLLEADASTDSYRALKCLLDNDRANGPRVLMTLRSDFLSHAQEHPLLGRILLHRTHGTYLLPSMSKEKLVQVMRAPLEHAPGVVYEEGLVERILEEVGTGFDALPLLSFTLKQLWEKRQSGVLRYSADGAPGSVRKAIGEEAEKIWNECVGNGADRLRREAAAKSLLTALIQDPTGEGAPLIRRPIARSDLADVRQQEMAEQFAARRLLVIGRDGEDKESPNDRISLIHDALITEWPRLRELAAADREFLRTRTRLSNGPPPRGRELAAIDQAVHDRELELSAAEGTALRRARTARRGRRAALLTGLVAAVAALTVIAVQSVVSTQRQDDSRSRELANLSEELNRQDPGLAALAATAAYDLSPTPEARTALQRRYDEAKDFAWRMTGVPAPIDAADMSTDGAVTLVTTTLGRATLFVRTSAERGGPERVRRYDLPLARNAVTPLVSRDGRRIAYSADGGTLIWHEVNRDAAAGEPLLGAEHRISGGEDLGGEKGSLEYPLDLADFSPDGSRAVTVSPGERPRIWDLEGNRSFRPPKKAPVLDHVWFGSDSKTLIGTATPDPYDSGDSIDLTSGRAVLTVDIPSGKEHVVTTGMVTSDVSGDGGVVTVCEEPSRRSVVYRSVRTSDGKETGRMSGSDRICPELTLDEAGERFAAKDGGIDAYAWRLMPTDGKPGKATVALGPAELATGAEPTPLLQLTGSEDAPVIAAMERRAVSGLQLDTGLGQTLDRAHMYSVNGETRIAARLDGGAELGLLDVSDQGRLRRLVSTDRPDSAVAVEEESLDGSSLPFAASVSQGLIADAVGPDRVQIRRFSTLSKVTEIRPPEPPVDDEGNYSDPVLFFHGDVLITLSGSRVDRWNPRTGKRVGKAVDLSRGKLAAGEPTPADGYWIAPGEKPGELIARVPGKAVFRSITLSDSGTFHEDKQRRIRFGPDARAVIFSPTRGHAAVQTLGGLVELWKVGPGRRTERIHGPTGPLGQNDATYQGGFAQTYVADSDTFALANGNSVRFHPPDNPAGGDRYAFSKDQKFLGISDDGKLLVRARSDLLDKYHHADLFRIDPAEWKEHLCHVLDHRALTEAEHGSQLPGYVPREICSQG